MHSMDYNQRISHISNWFKSDIIIRFNMPRDVDAKVSAMDVIEAINANLPSPLSAEQIGNLLASITKEVSRSAKSRTLPTIKEFIDAARASTQSRQTASHSADSTSWRIDPLQIAIKRVTAGEAICESWLREPRRTEILKNVTEDQLRKYDLYIAAHTH
jgi:hypothetical protein